MFDAQTPEQLQELLLTMEDWLMAHAAWVDISANDFCLSDKVYDRLPLQWQHYFNQCPMDAPQHLLWSMTRFVPPPDGPDSLAAYLEACQRFSFLPDRTASITPFANAGPLPAGMDPQKAHEVAALKAMLIEDFSDGHITCGSEVGSGKAYLSRSLTQTGIDMLGIEMSPQNIEQAKRLDKITQTASMDYLQAQVTQDTLREVIQRRSQQSKGHHLMIALHACGDLAVHCLKVFSPVNASMVVVGCCYQWLDPASLNLSGQLNRLVFTRHHLLCAAQNPAFWSLEELQLSTKKLFWRARLQKELVDQHVTITGRVGRLRDSAYTSYPRYRSAALKRLKLPDVMLEKLNSVDPPELPDASRAFFRFQAFWVLRCMLGPVLEAAILLDRLLFLKRQYPQTQLRCLFDPASGSLRNMAYVVKGSQRNA